MIARTKGGILVIQTIHCIGALKARPHHEPFDIGVVVANARDWITRRIFTGSRISVALMAGLN